MGACASKPAEAPPASASPAVEQTPAPKETTVKGQDNWVAAISAQGPDEARSERGSGKG